MNSKYIFRPLNLSKGKEDAIKQANLYNNVTKDLPGPNSKNATVNGILYRQKLDYFDPVGTLYAINEDTDEFVSYCQSIQVTENIIRIGFPWSLPETPEEVKQELFEKVYSYYIKKYSGKELEFEIYTIDERWVNEIHWLENQGFKFYAYWIWPTFDITKINFDVKVNSFRFRDALETDFKNMNKLRNKNDDQLRFKNLPESILEKKFNQMLKFTNFHKFLLKENDILGFITVILPQDKNEPATILSLYVIEDQKEEEYARILLAEAIRFINDNGFKKGTAWFKEESLFHKCLKPFLQDELKWYHATKRNN